jgi:hypothetical protein
MSPMKAQEKSEKQNKQNMSYYYTLHNILLCKSNKTSWMFNGKFADDGAKRVNNPKIYLYNVEGNNRM